MLCVISALISAFWTVAGVYKKAVLWHGKGNHTCNAVENFDTYRNCQRHRAVLSAIAQLSCCYLGQIADKVINIKHLVLEQTVNVRSIMEATNNLLRIATFSVNPDAFDSPLQLSRRGLFYDSRSSLFCVYCGLEVPAFGERPLDYHGQLSPRCSRNSNTNDNAMMILRATLLRLQSSEPPGNLNVHYRQPGLSFAQLNIHMRPSHASWEQGWPI